MVLPAPVHVLLGELERDRRLHSVAVGEKAAANVHLVADHLRHDLVTAAALHDVGYAHPVTGFHPIDGARFLADKGFSAVVCHLVAHHSASTYEAEARNIDLQVYRQFDVVGTDLGSAHAVIWWADLTTGPQGQDMAVEERLNEIAVRYAPEHVVARNIVNIRDVLLEAGRSPVGFVELRS